jgi:hypothetical protein
VSFPIVYPNPLPPDSNRNLLIPQKRAKYKNFLRAKAKSGKVFVALKGVI